MILLTMKTSRALLIHFLCISVCVVVCAKTDLDFNLQNAPVFRPREVLLQPIGDDFTLGKANAKVHVTIFDSYSCIHCARFYKEIFPILKRDYIDEGKIFFIHKDFPLDKRALFATKVVRCSKNKFSSIQAIYHNQSKLLNGKTYENQLLAISDISKECVNTQDEEDITKQAFEYGKVLEIRGTPTIFINGVKLEKFSKNNIINAIELELYQK